MQKNCLPVPMFFPKSGSGEVIFLHRTMSREKSEIFANFVAHVGLEREKLCIDPIGMDRKEIWALGVSGWKAK